MFASVKMGRPISGRVLGGEIQQEMSYYKKG
jgi:hypothetical protein